MALAEHNGASFISQMKNITLSSMDSIYFMLQMMKPFQKLWLALLLSSIFFCYFCIRSKSEASPEPCIKKEEVCLTSESLSREHNH